MEVHSTECVEDSNEALSPLNGLHHGSTYFYSNSDLVYCEVNFVQKMSRVFKCLLCT